MTKTSSDCDATVLSTSQPDRMGNTAEMQRLYEQFGCRGEFSEQELSVIDDLAELHQISQMQTIRQALRFYQLHEKRIGDGETFAWSGDKARAEEFAALAAAPAVGGEAVRDLIERLRHPLWVHSDAPFESPQLAKAEVVADMRAAADEIDRLRAALAAQPASPLRGIPEKLTGELACILENCSPPEKQTDEAVAALILSYQATWDRIVEVLSASPPEPASPLRGREALIEQCVKIASAGAKQCVDGDTEWHRGFKYAASNTALGIADSLRALSASPPEQPASPKNLLRERESVREIAHRHCTCTCTDDPKVMINHSNLCDEISDAILEYADRILLENDWP